MPSTPRRIFPKRTPFVPRKNKPRCVSRLRTVCRFRPGHGDRKFNPLPVLRRRPSGVTAAATTAPQLPCPAAGGAAAGRGPQILSRAESSKRPGWCEPFCEEPGKYPASLVLLREAAGRTPCRAVSVVSARLGSARLREGSRSLSLLGYLSTRLHHPGFLTVVSSQDERGGATFCRGDTRQRGGPARPAVCGCVVL